MKKPLTAAAAAKEKAKKHVAAEKAARTRAKDKAEHKPVHHAKVKVSHKPVVKRRKWSPDSDVACCSARAVAEAVRLLSGPVLSDADVVSLHWAAGGDRDGGASILDVLSAASELFRWQAIGTACLPGILAPDVFQPSLPHPSQDAVPYIESAIENLNCHGLILGLDLPWGEPHAVTVDLDGTWWSWGEPYLATDFPGAVIDECWAVSWS